MFGQFQNYELNTEFVDVVDMLRKKKKEKTFGSRTNSRTDSLFTIVAKKIPPILAITMQTYCKTSIRNLINSWPWEAAKISPSLPKT